MSLAEKPKGDPAGSDAHLHLSNLICCPLHSLHFRGPVPLPFLLHAKHVLTPGPLHLRFPQLGMCTAPFFPPSRSLLKCHLNHDAFPDHLI